MSADDSTPPRRSWFSLGDAVFIFWFLVAMTRTTKGALDDPGLGWNLRIADLIWETGAFPHAEVFSDVTAGKPWVAYSWLGDVFLRLAYEWGGMNGLGVLLALTIALVLWMLYQRMLAEGVPAIAAAGWTLVAGMGTMVGWVARPNMFSYIGIVLTAAIAQGFHSGRLSRKASLWLIPLFLVWANVHSGFLSGALLLAIVYLVECGLAVAATDAEVRTAARSRVVWWTGLGIAVFLATLINPYGIGLYRWTVGLMSDPFIQESSTTEWRSSNFKDDGWYLIELVVLLFPFLAAVSRRRVASATLVVAVVWLHFALTGRRFAPLWVLLVVPALAQWALEIPWLQHVGRWVRENTSPDFQGRFAGPARWTWAPSLAFALLALTVCRWLPQISRHHEPAFGELHELLDRYEGQRVFHSANWGGYLVWHGWQTDPRFKIWIDDRVDVHGKEHTVEYFDLMGAKPGWQEILDKKEVTVLCLPIGVPLANAAAADPNNWKEVYRGQAVVIFERIYRRTRSLIEREQASPAITSSRGR
jgi:hypothetical protein